MDIDDRLEALAQTVEIIAGMQRSNEEAHQKNEALVARVVSLVENLTRAVQNHEGRISGLEGGRA